MTGSRFSARCPTPPAVRSSGLLLALNLLLVSHAGAVGLTTEQAVRARLASARAWWTLFTLILLPEDLEQRAVVELSRHAWAHPLLLEPPLERPAQGGELPREEHRGSVQRAREAAGVPRGKAGRGEERHAGFAEQVVERANLDAGAGRRVREHHVHAVDRELRQQPVGPVLSADEPDREPEAQGGGQEAVGHELRHRVGDAHHERERSAPTRRVGLYQYALWAFPQDPRLTAIPGFTPEAAAWQTALEFLTGYVVEFSLSVDNTSGSSAEFVGASGWLCGVSARY